MKTHSIARIMEHFERRAPAALSASWDNDGALLVLHSTREETVSRALTCLDVTDAAVDFAIGRGCDLIVSHHPFIFEPIKRVDSETDPQARLLARMAAADIQCVALHTRLDCADGGLNSHLAALLHMRGITPLDSPGEGLVKVGRIGELAAPTQAGELAKQLAEALGAHEVLLTGQRGIVLRTAAIVTGSGKHFAADAYRAEADALITGELAHETRLWCAAMGLCALEAGHRHTELPAAGILAKWLGEIGLEALVFEGEPVSEMVRA